MKFSGLILSLSLIAQLAFCQNVTIKGVFQNNQSDSIVLQSFTQENKVNKTFPIKKTGEFEIKVMITSAGYFKLGYDDKNILVLILHPGDNITVQADALNLFGSTQVTGSPSTQQFYNANMQFAAYKAQKDSIQKVQADQLQLVEMKEENYAINFIKQNPKSLASLMLAEKVNKESHPEILFMLDSNLYIEYPTNQLVQDFHTEISSMKFLSIGSEIPEVTLEDKTGKKVSLSSLRGKIVIIDFWATWCGPCRQEIPNVKRTYADFHDKGLEVFSISLDRSKDQWLNGITEMPWICVFDEGSKVASQFNVQGIPFMLIVDRNGKIAAKNLRGNQLYLKVSDMLN